MCPKGWQQLLKPKRSLEATCQSCSVEGISRGAGRCPVFAQQLGANPGLSWPCAPGQPRPQLRAGAAQAPLRTEALPRLLLLPMSTAQPHEHSAAPAGWQSPSGPCQRHPALPM